MKRYPIMLTVKDIDFTVYMTVNDMLDYCAKGLKSTIMDELAGGGTNPQAVVEKYIKRFQDRN